LLSLSIGTVNFSFLAMIAGSDYRKKYLHLRACALLGVVGFDEGGAINRR